MPKLPSWSRRFKRAPYFSASMAPAFSRRFCTASERQLARTSALLAHLSASHTPISVLSVIFPCSRRLFRALGDFSKLSVIQETLKIGETRGEGERCAWKREKAGAIERERRREPSTIFKVIFQCLFLKFFKACFRGPLGVYKRILKKKIYGSGLLKINQSMLAFITFDLGGQ